jgi:hypothetical protein
MIQYALLTFQRVMRLDKAALRENYVAYARRADTDAPGFSRFSERNKTFFELGFPGVCDTRLGLQPE